jgi:hypothetical protein
VRGISRKALSVSRRTARVVDVSTNSKSSEEVIEKCRVEELEIVVVEEEIEESRVLQRRNL